MRRLGADHIDLYRLLHGWDGQTALRGKPRRAGRRCALGQTVHYVGCSNYSAWHLMKALAVADRRGLERFASHRIYWSLIGRDAEVKNSCLPALDQGLGILVWSPLAGGLLTGKYRRDTKPSGTARHLTDWGEPPVYDEAKVYNVIDAVVAIAEGHGVPPAQVALAWQLTRPGVSSVIVGARNEQQVSQSLGAADLELGPEEIERLSSVSASPLPYPLWHQSRTAGERQAERRRPRGSRRLSTQLLPVAG